MYPVNAQQARAVQRLLGKFIYGELLMVESNDRNVKWTSFGDQASILNITSTGFDIQQTLSKELERRQKLNAILEDPKNGI